MNQYAGAARARKVAAISMTAHRLQRETGRSNAGMVAWLSTLDDTQWTSLALLSGVRPPSETTREMVVRQFLGSAQIKEAS